MKPIKSWCAYIEPGAQKQVENLARHVAVFMHPAVMPGCHEGYGMPIESIVALDGAISPNMVGADVGCGVDFCQTNVPVQILRAARDKQDRNLLKLFVGDVPRSVPTGFDKHKEPQVWAGFNNMPDIEILNNNLENAKLSLGTMGGNNHFIELQSDPNGNMCIAIHSGSRNLGLQIGKHYDKIADELCRKWFYTFEADAELAFLPTSSNEGHEYLACMNFAIKFADENRRLMMERVKSLMFNLVTKYYGSFKFEILQEIKARHNYASLESHFGKNVWVHRKGAIRARKSDIGIIPGSMGTPTYIVRGKENADSFHSCSHGGGRRMSRKAANETLKEEDVRKSLEGIEHTKFKDGNLAEAPGAYKDINTVMKAQEDLVDVIMELKPLAVVKG